MNEIKVPKVMLIVGTLAGVLSGFMFFWLRAGLFSFALTLTVLLARSNTRRWVALIPGLALGVGLGFFPAYFPDFGMGDLETSPAYDFHTLLNCTLFIPIYAYAYSRSKWWSRIWRMLLAGGLSCILRSISLDGHDWYDHISDSFVFGILPFALFWLLAMRFTDPRCIREHAENSPEDLS